MDCVDNSAHYTTHIATKRQQLEDDLAYYEEKLAHFRSARNDSAIDLAALYECRTWHVRKLLNALPTN